MRACHKLLAVIEKEFQIAAVRVEILRSGVSLQFSEGLNWDGALRR